MVFPRVKLEAPSASLANVNETLAVSYGPMNRLINTAEWDAQLTALSWNEVADADLYRIELTDKDDNSTTVTVDMSGNLPEIILNGQNTFAVAGDDWYTVKQGSAVNGRYSLTNGSIRYYSYQPDTMLQVKDGTFTLKLPNIFSVVTHENQTLQLTNGIHRYWVASSCRSPQALAISVIYTLIVLIINYLRVKRKSVSVIRWRSDGKGLSFVI